MKLSARAARLLQGLAALGTEDADSPPTQPWDCLLAIAGMLGQSVDQDTGMLPHEANASGLKSKSRKRHRQDTSLDDDGRGLAAGSADAKPRERAGVADAEHDSSEADHSSLSGESSLIPPFLLADDHGTLYLDQFEAEVLQDDRDARDVVPFEQLVAEGDPEALFQWMISPCSRDTFFAGVFELKPLLIRRAKAPAYNSGAFADEDVWRLLRQGKLRYNFNIDVTLFTASDRRKNFNHNGKEPLDLAEGEWEVADEQAVRSRYRQGCSVRLLHPQRYCDAIWKALALLEQLLQCPMGCNVYLTPPGSQGFAPHYDDVDVFILQTQGIKRWRVYKPRADGILPRFSSRDFEDDEIGPCILDVKLHPGDFLYLPRGCIHQAESLPGELSLHLTISANQRRTWYDFLHASLLTALKQVQGNCVAYRATMPQDYFSYMGIMHASDDDDDAHGAQSLLLGDKPACNGNSMALIGGMTMPDDSSESDHVGPSSGAGTSRSAAKNGLMQTRPSKADQDARRRGFRATVRQLLARLTAELNLDEGADEAAADFVAQRLPPFGLPAPPPSPVDDLPQGVKLRRCGDNLARIVDADSNDEDTLTVVHCLNNNRLAHASINDEPDKEENEDEEQDVLKMSYFLIPVSIANVVAQLLASAEGVDVSELLQGLQDEDELDADEAETALEAVLTMYNLGILTHCA